MMKMSRLAPLTQAIQKKYENDPQKAQAEIQQIYKEEGASMMGGCLWSSAAAAVALPLSTVIRQPLVYMLHLSADQAAKIVEIIKEAIPAAFLSNSYYDQLSVAPHLTEFAAQIREAIPELANTTPAQPELPIFRHQPGSDSQLAVLEVGGHQLGFHRSVPPAGVVCRLQRSVHVDQPEDERLCHHGSEWKPG